ncbi:hypothetical protein RchiOBHm_Chr3g0454161 [Rosa chinensis]|uniref:Uncharacterized protein n=1 Tax=Rosa chinensis TaxID=74649 RepID=A0A2P6R6U2_ROSCH|nr:hypothetical protein RchiOBHm_Chr3g0454161 [Rosa chinensis]
MGKVFRSLLFASFLLPPGLTLASFQGCKRAEENLNRRMEKKRREELSDE